MYIGNLCFFKVGIYLYIGGWNDCYQWCCWVNLCFRLYCVVGDIIGYWIDNMSMFQCQLGVMYFGGSLLYGWLIFQFSFQNYCLIGIVLLNCDVQLCLGIGDGVVGVLQFFVINQVGIVQWYMVVVVVLCFCEGDFLYFNICL